MRVDLRAGDEAVFAQYDSFRVDSAADYYRLHLAGYHGTAGESGAWGLGGRGRRLSLIPAPTRGLHELPQRQCLLCSRPRPQQLAHLLRRLLPRGLVVQELPLRQPQWALREHSGPPGEGLGAAQAGGGWGSACLDVRLSVTGQVTEPLRALIVKEDNNATSPRCLEEEMVYWMERASSGLSPPQLRVRKTAGREG